MKKETEEILNTPLTVNQFFEFRLQSALNSLKELQVKASTISTSSLEVMGIMEVSLEITEVLYFLEETLCSTVDLVCHMKPGLNQLEVAENLRDSNTFQKVCLEVAQIKHIISAQLDEKALKVINVGSLPSFVEPLVMSHSLMESDIVIH